MELFHEFQTFIHSLPTTITTTNLSGVREKAKFITPLSISNDDIPENFNKMSVVILQNLLNYHDDNEMFPIPSLKLLLDLIGTFDISDSITKSKLMLLLHGTKLKLSSERLCSWFVKVELMKEMIIDDTHERLNRWETLASLTLNHPVVIEVIKSLATDGTGICLPNILSSIQVEIIDCTLAGLRGFCGINKIYINAAYIRSQMSTYSTTFHPDSPIGKSVVEMDICTIAIHEFCHARLRQITNNPNTCTPDLFRSVACSTVNERSEFGRLCEMVLFFDKIDYWRSAADNKWDLDYFQKFIKAIESSSAIPPFNSTNNYIKRFPSTTSGLDIDLTADDYYV
ncbi:unnamed protein product [Rotaria sp. Silwood1]|nr:unnamed protein product [Rotaria sp. Silwood1]CAF3334337.1 unnamed protein product [Rotaria sp. Silwood1]